MAKKPKFKSSILDWFEREGREFPWRRSTNPYHVLIAEMLLRRTTATAVMRVYPIFIEKYPTIKQVASAHLSSLRKILKSLGLQKIRASQIRDTARLISNRYQGHIPNEYESLSCLPGIGRYSANAILNFAFNKPRMMVDGNIMHLLNRILSLEKSDVYENDLWLIMDTLGEPHHEKQLYWGIIDLVAGICLRTNPKCLICPLLKICDYEKQPKQSQS
jgi:A/G-specific adenine glycosylase